MSKRVLLGAALSASQCEGAYLEDGKGLSICDTVPSKNRDFNKLYGAPTHDFHYPTHTAVDFYHQYLDDIKYMKDCGIDCLRFSIAWSRIFSTDNMNQPNKKGIDFYTKVIDALIESGIEPIVTISHLEVPYYLVSEYGGWENKEMIQHYIAYSKYLINHFKGKVKYWITFNEINMAMHFPGVLGVRIDTSTNIEKTKLQSVHNILVANARTIKYAKEVDPNCQIGAMIAYSPIYPYTCDPEDIYKAMSVERETLFISDVLVRGKYPSYLLPKIKELNIDINEDESNDLHNVVDFLALSYYSSNAISVKEADEQSSGNLFGGIKNPYVSATEWGWQIDPKGFRYSLNVLYDRYQLPLMIVENGIGAIDKLENEQVNDDYRIKFLSEHIEQMNYAIADGVDILAYTMWSFLDQVSASSGQMSKRYGLVYCDVDDEGKGTFKRYPKKSFYWYQNYLKNRK